MAGSHQDCATRNSRIFSALVAGCGGGGGASSPPPPAPPPPISKIEAYRFLNQATFGATEAEAQRLIALGDSTNSYSRWLDEQFAKAPSTQLPTVVAAVPNPIPAGFNIGSLQAQRVEAWFQNSLNGDDQLRQRVAFALSEIMVVSQVGALAEFPAVAGRLLRHVSSRRLRRLSQADSKT